MHETRDAAGLHYYTSVLHCNARLEILNGPLATYKDLSLNLFLRNDKPAAGKHTLLWCLLGSCRSPAAPLHCILPWSWPKTLMQPKSKDRTGEGNYGQ